MLKIIVHDYAGHPFPLTLSEELSNKHEVHHLYFGNDYGPKADFKNSINKNLKIENIGKEINYNKKNFVKRFFKDIQYGHLLAKRIDEIKPDIVLSGQCPTFAQESIINISKKNNAKFIMWIQDFYSIAVENILKKKISYFSTIFTFLFKYYEKKQVRIADHLIVISSEFKYQLKNYPLGRKKMVLCPLQCPFRGAFCFSKKTFRHYIVYSLVLRPLHCPCGRLFVPITTKRPFGN